MGTSWQEATKSAPNTYTGDDPYLTALDKDQLVDSATPFVITNIAYDSVGFKGQGARWLLSVEPYGKGTWPRGLLAMPSNPQRDAQMTAAADAIDPDSYIGPVVLDRAGARGFLVLRDATNVAPKQPGLPGAPEVAPALSAPPAAPEAPTAPPVATPPRGQRGRPPKQQSLAAQEIKPQARQEAVKQQAQEALTPKRGKGFCASCGQDVSDDAWPTTDGNFALLHKCPVLGNTIPIAVTELS